jgi:hypothetical protein
MAIHLPNQLRHHFLTFYILDRECRCECECTFINSNFINVDSCRVCLYMWQRPHLDCPKIYLKDDTGPLINVLNVPQ